MLANFSKRSILGVCEHLKNERNAETTLLDGFSYKFLANSANSSADTAFSVTLTLAFTDSTTFCS